ncbi:fumarylacetoacetate hydrolase family protein [Actinospongicola halichondriae]|uniref:fumarylacetoacetate hydrolase family protein n=1 Tax=Actinospongicola halichondriae TaxID=3236844 RepID=UPI003D4D5790
MKLIRVGAPGAEIPGVLTNEGRRVDASAFLSSIGHRDYDERFFAGDAIDRLAAWEPDGPTLEDGDRLGSPVARPSKIICVGLNFRDHAAETGQPEPDEPILFGKATTALCGPDDDLVIPRGSTATDWEVELAVVIGRAARYVSVDDALGHVAGYALHNDYSERVHQMERGGQWIKGKSHDTYAPLGPFLATPDEVGGDAGDLAMWLTVNGETRQQSSTNQLIFGIAELVSHISDFMTLLPGDVISTGTPGGVGLSFDPPIYLKPGDVVELGIDGLGTSRQQAVAYS